MLHTAQAAEEGGWDDDDDDDWNQPAPQKGTKGKKDEKASEKKSDKKGKDGKEKSKQGKPESDKGDKKEKEKAKEKPKEKAKEKEKEKAKEAPKEKEKEKKEEAPPSGAPVRPSPRRLPVAQFCRGPCFALPPQATRAWASKSTGRRTPPTSARPPDGRTPLRCSCLPLPGRPKQLGRDGAGYPRGLGGLPWVFLAGG